MINDSEDPLFLSTAIQHGVCFGVGRIKWREKGKKGGPGHMVVSKGEATKANDIATSLK